MRHRRTLANVLCLALLGAGVLGSADAKAEPVPCADAALPADAITGEWWTEGKEGRVRFVKAADGTYTGILVAGAEAGKDVNNKDPKKRDRQLAGIVLMWNLTYENGEYVNGWVYNPRDGDTYRFKASMKSKTSLEVRGYLGISLFGQTQTWTR